MAARTSRDDESISDINIVPLVDIVLVVLIIFMVTAPAMMKPHVPVQLPEASSGDETTPSLLHVGISAEGRVSVNQQEVTEEEARRLAAAQLEKNPDIQAIIAADREVAHGTVVMVMDWIKSTGVRRFAVTTESSGK